MKAESTVSIMPRRLKPGGTVTIHFGIINRRQVPISPLVRLSVIDPVGRLTRLFQDHVLVFPNFSEDDTLIERRRRMLNRYFQFDVPRDAELGRYRVKLENFYDGNMLYSETMESDFFFVEKVNVIRDGSRFCVSNEGPEAVPIALHECLDDGKFHSTLLEVQPLGTVELAPKRVPAFLEYSGNEVASLSHNGESFSLRNQRYFWRKEDEATIFVLDPRAERKRNFFLSGRAMAIWQQSDGCVLREEVRTEENASLYDEMVSKKLIVEFKR